MKMIILFIFLIPLNLYAQTILIYDRSGINVLYRVEGSLIYEGRVGGSVVYNIQRGQQGNILIYEGRVPIVVKYNIQNNFIYEGRNPITVIYNIRGNYIYEGRSPITAVYRTERR